MKRHKFFPYQRRNCFTNKQKNNQQQAMNFQFQSLIIDFQKVLEVEALRKLEEMINICSRRSFCQVIVNSFFLFLLLLFYLMVKKMINLKPGRKTLEKLAEHFLKYKSQFWHILICKSWKVRTKCQNNKFSKHELSINQSIFNYLK